MESLNKPIQFNSVDLRDGQQSILATRMTTNDMLPVLSRMDDIGFNTLEMWGGATFDVCIRYLNEDPWDRIRKFKRIVKKTPLKMVLRGQNLVGYRAYPDDIVEKFVEKAAEAGIDVFLIFDAIQDLRNCETAFNAVKKAGKTIEGSLQYTISPIHTIESYVESAKKQEKMGASRIHIEDMAGLMTPTIANKLITALKKEVDIPIDLQSHSIGGMSEMAYWEAAKAGVDGLDICVSPLSMGTSLPAVESMIAAFQGTDRDPKIDVKKFEEIDEYLLWVRNKYKEHETKLVGVDVDCLEHQVPGGMLSNLESQLRAMKMEDKLEEVMKEVTRVRKDMGYPPLATPSSQICGSQATFNIMNGERYKTISNEMKNYCKGKYGMPPGEIDPDLLEKVLGDEEPITCRPADLIEPYFEKAKEEIKDITNREEDILTYALFPNVGLKFLKNKYNV